MSTHCGIAIKTEKGYETIYVHFDGYPEYMWPMLTENYNSEELAAKLVSMGDASCIDEKLDPSDKSHRFGRREEGVSVFYHRDRGDDWLDVAPTVYEKKYILNWFYYYYIWEDGHWNFYKDGNLQPQYQ